MSHTTRTLSASTQLALAVAAVAGLGASARAATVTLTATDAVGTTSFNTGLHWSDSNPPAPGNAYQVNSTTAALAVRTPPDQATDITFAGDSLTLTGASATIRSGLTIKNLTNTNTTVNNLTLDFGEIQNGGTVAGAATSVTLTSNAITINAGGAYFNGGLAGRVLTINAPLSGVGGVNALTTGGTIVLGGAGNTFAGNVVVTGSGITTAGVPGGALRANDGTTLPTTANLSLGGGILQTGVNMVRAAGTGANQIQITGGAVNGFSAVGADVTVAIGGTASPTPLVWGTAPFNPGILVLNDSAATNTLTFANAIDNGGTTRTIFSMAGTANVNGVITGTGGLNVYGAGTVVLTAANNLTGQVTIGTNVNSTTSNIAGVVRATASGALGTGTVVPGSSGNATTGRLELANNVVLSNPIFLPQRNNTTVAIENISGNNELSGTIALNAGGAASIVQSDAGTLTLSGASVAAAGVAIGNGGGSRTATLQGTGSGVVSGIIQNGTGTTSLAKAGSGTWTLTAANTYTGTTVITGGTLRLGNGTAGNDGTIAGTTGVAIDAGATLAYNRFGSTSAAYVISGSGAISKAGTGTQVLTGANTYTGGTTVTGGTLELGAAAQTPVLGSGAAGADIQNGQVNFDYIGASPAGSIRTLLQASFQDATTPGVMETGQLRSTTSTARRGLGYVDNGTAVVVKATLFGDVNLDGGVLIGDFNVFAPNFGSPSGKVWADGDFNYDGAVNIGDFNLLAVNFGQSLPPAADWAPLIAFAAAHNDLETFASLTGVPEPTSLGLLSAGATLALRRRRRA